MILEYKIDYRSSSLVYEKIFVKELQKHNLEGRLQRDGFVLKLYVQAKDAQELEQFADSFAASLPNSIFLHSVEANVVEQMPQTSLEIDNSYKLELPFCPECKAKVEDSSSDSYYDISTKCEVCGYSATAKSQNYKAEFEAIAKEIADGKIVTLDTFYATYHIGKLGSVCNDISFDILSYDLATVAKYTHSNEYELNLLASFEKPMIKLKTNTKFLMDFEDVSSELVRFKLSDDFVLHCLTAELHALGIDMVFLTQDSITTQATYNFVQRERDLAPIEIVASAKEMLIVSGNKGLPLIRYTKEPVNKSIDRLYSIMEEQHLDDDNITCINLEKENETAMLVYGKKYGMVEYLSLGASFSSIKEIFATIASTNESGLSLVKNYKAKYPELFEKIVDIEFDNPHFNIYRLWGVIAIILGYTNETEPSRASQKIGANIEMFLGKKGPRIDYKLYNKDGKVHYDPLMTIRTAMSFKLAGVDELMLSFGVMESFIEFIVNEIDEAQNSMSTTSVIFSGDMFTNKAIFDKFVTESSINHQIYTHNEVSMDLSNLVYQKEE